MKKNLQSKFDTRQYMVSKDFEIFYYDDTQLSRVSSHTHNYYEFYFFLEGAVSMHIHEKMHPLKPGDVLMIPPHVPHHISNRNPDIPYRRFVFWISEEYYRRLCSVSEDYAYIAFQATERQQHIYHNDIISFNALQAKLFRLIEELHSNRFGKDTKLSLCVEDLLLHINRLAYEKHHPKKKKEKQNLYENLISYIEDNLEEDLSLDHLAEVFFISKYHISHIFKENLGIPIHSYITKKRLAMCRDALLSDGTISKTFLMYGFKDYSSFYRAFKKEYGLSPKEYKEIYGIREMQ